VTGWSEGWRVADCGCCPEVGYRVVPFGAAGGQLAGVVVQRGGVRLGEVGIQRAERGAEISCGEDGFGFPRRRLARGRSAPETLLVRR
jgi:hypothetical protein